MQVIAVDWSGNAASAAASTAVAVVRDGKLVSVQVGRTGTPLADHLRDLAATDLHTVVGLDFAFSLPAWFLDDRGFTTAIDLWRAARLDGEQWLRGSGPFWGRPGVRRPELPEHFRQTDRAVPSVGGITPKSVFQVGGAGSVGTGSIRGMPFLLDLVERGFHVWPFGAGSRLVVEIYPRILTGAVVKSSAEARRTYLADPRWNLSPTLITAAAFSEDTFDAAISAMVMAQHAAELAALQPATDVTTRLEGAIWFPAPNAPAAARSQPPNAAPRHQAGATIVNSHAMEPNRPPSLIDRAMAMAVHAHSGYTDKAGQPYLLHVLRVMSRMGTEEERLVAILHDVVEDSDFTIDDLRAQGFPDAVVAAVARLAKPDDADYMGYVARLRDDPLARAVKMADLEDNMDMRRIAHPTDKDLARVRKYREAWQFLSTGPPRSNSTAAPV